MLRDAKKQLTLCSLLDSDSAQLYMYVSGKSSYKPITHQQYKWQIMANPHILQFLISPLIIINPSCFPNRLSIILTLIIHLRIKSMASKPLQDSEPCMHPSQPNPRRVLETIYGSRFMRNSKQLTPLNTSAQAKNPVGGVSSDYYTFQRSLANSKNKNPERPAEKFRKTFCLAKPSTTQLMAPTSSRNMLTKYKSTNPRSIINSQGHNRSSTKLIMNNTSTGFNNTPKSPEKPSYNMNLLNNTAQNFRPPTNGYMRQCNNEAEDHNNYLSKYEIIKQLGKGTYGVVHLARKKMQQSSRSPRKLDDSFLFAYGTQKRERQEHQTTLQFHQQQSDAKIIVSSSIVEQKNESYLPAIEGIPHEESAIVNKEAGSDLRQSKIFPVPEQSLAESIDNSQGKKQNPGTLGGQEFDQTQELFAIKIYEKFKMNKDPTKFKNIRKEINIMQNIKHQHIIKLYETVETLTKISLVVEYGGKQSLLDYLKDNYPLSEPVMRKIGSQLLSALQYLHEKNIVHRDIKLQNILMLNGDVKIIDFGFSTLTYKNRKLNAICGTPNYMAPEVLSKKEYIGELADMWSYGVVMFTIAEGRHPFKADTYNELQRFVNKGIYQFRKITNPVHQSFIKRILKTKPQDRPRACDLTSHPWLAMKEDSIM